MFNAKLWINPEKNWFQIIFLSTYSPLRKFQNSRKYKKFKTEVDTQIGLLNLWVYDIVVLLHHFLLSNFITTVRFLVECQEEEEVLNTGEREHQRCSHGIVTSEEERLKQSTDEKMNRFKWRVQFGNKNFMTSSRISVCSSQTLVKAESGNKSIWHLQGVPKNTPKI